ncbi:MAG TPA: ABC transporter substrate-binding protein [Methylomirabilota bacterium]|jgi:ABC-type nitrate/sulfonate/bicarbonate transport system substrate-binding protein|nr:ABC transporter substrate-binding protein [Methylomirabilota bacterium]
MSAIARIAVPDLVTNSYFPALAGEELGFYRAQGLDGRVELLAPAPRAMAALRDGEVDFVVTGAHTTLTAFPGFQGAKLAVTVAQGTPWLLVLRADVPATRGDVRAVKGLRIGAAPGPDAALGRLLAEAGVDPERDGVQIARVPGTERPGASFGVLAAEALRAGLLDGFWANALGSETAVRQGVGRIVVDVRRGDGPPAARDFTFAALVTTEALIARDPQRVAAAVRGIVAAQRALRAAPGRASDVGRRRFPPAAAEMIATLVERDLPFYDPTISESSVTAVSAFARALGLLAAPVAYDDVVATRFRDLWMR